MIQYGNFCFLLLSLSIAADLSTAYGEGASPDYVPGQVIIMLDSTAHEFSGALRSASQSQSNLTGYTVFDSLSGIHSLQNIDASPESPLTRTLFVLTFPDDADIPVIAAAYVRAAGVDVAEPNYLLQTTIGTGVDAPANSLIRVGTAQGLARRSIQPNGSQRLQILRLTLSEAYPETLRLIRNAMRRDSVWTGISSFDSLKHGLGLTWFHLPSHREGASKDSMALFLTRGGAWDIGEITERFRVLPYVAQAVLYPQKVLKESRSK